jgi:hypothetical protein
MNTPARAIVWQLWRRHHHVLLLSAAILVLMAITYPWLLHAFQDDALSRTVFIVSLLPPILVFAFVANVLIYSDEVGSLTAGYPRRMFTLPVPTRTLVAWPLLIASLVVCILWAFLALCVYRPSGYDAPVMWPAMVLIVTMVGAQALSWSPVDQVFRLWLAILGYALFVAVPLDLHLMRQISATSLMLIFAALLPVLYVIAYRGVASDRRGDRWGIGLSGFGSRLAAYVPLPRGPRDGFGSAGGAQFWYELRCHGLILPVFAFLQASAVAGFSLCLGHANDRFLLQMTLGVLASTPVLLAGSLGSGLGRMRPFWDKSREPVTFLSVRPVTTGALVWAKFRMAAFSVALSWLLVVFVAGVYVLAKHDTIELEQFFQSLRADFGGARGAAALAVAVIFGPLLTWKLLTDSVVPVLTGRRWIADGAVTLGVAFILGLIALGTWCARNPSYINDLVAAVLILAVIGLVVRVVVTAVGFVAARKRGLVSGREITVMVAAWFVLALVLAGGTHLMLRDGELPVSRPIAVLAAVSFLPMARFPLAPLALDWNRHR